MKTLTEATTELIDSLLNTIQYKTTVKDRNSKH